MPFLILVVALCLVPILLGGLYWLITTITEVGRKREAWQSFAREIGGSYRAGSWGQVDQVQAKIQEWPFSLDTYIVGTGKVLETYTRMRAFYPTIDGFRFGLFSKSAIHSDIPAFSLPPVPVQPELDLVIYSNDQSKLQLILADTAILTIVQSLRSVGLEVRQRRNWREAGVSMSIYEVHVEQRGIVTDSQRLTTLFALTRAVLTRLYEIGSAGYSFANALPR